MDKFTMAVDDDLVFAEESDEHTSACAVPWRLLVVDDDHDVHETTKLALRGLRFFDRPLEMLHAYSAAEAIDCLRREPDIGVILLDVVMETITAGLEIIGVIRDELGLLNTRIILRTGQPGYAPEIDTIRRYDINDYKTKSELTRNKLFTTLSSALRTYDQLCRVDASRRGLEQIVAASRELMSEREMVHFASRVLAELSHYVGVPADGLICSGQNSESASVLTILAGAGRFAQKEGQPLAEAAPELIERIGRCIAQRGCLIEPEGIAFYLSGMENQIVTGFIYLDKPVTVDHKLLEVFCANIALGSDNVRLFERLRNAAFSDPLTGLPNRTALIQAIDQRIREKDTAETTLALIDIDQFSAFNDLFGHRYGDQLLLAVARRMTE